MSNGLELFTADHIDEVATLINTTPPERVTPDETSDLVVAFIVTSSHVTWFRVVTATLKATSILFQSQISLLAQRPDHHRFLIIRSCEDMIAGARCVLSLIHHYNIDNYKSIDLATFDLAARFSHLFGFNHALSSWVFHWCKELRHRYSQENTDDNGENDGNGNGNRDEIALPQLLEAAHRFDFDDPKLRKLAAFRLCQSFLRLWPNSNGIGYHFAGTKLLSPFSPCNSHLGSLTNMSAGLQVQSSYVFDRLVKSLFSLDGLISDRQRAYGTSRQLCLKCERRLPAEAKKCHPCRNSDLLRDVCTSASRVGNYIAALHRHSLWPQSELQNLSISEVAKRVEEMDRGTSHNCDRGGRCPLVMHMAHLSRTTKALLEQPLVNVN
ncbi:hypothetical protein CKAH01_06872 [Colletotrichum kahawae]|uniref:BTB domain-containing protein n=1 Tax=Colletotrichum kahawae TaxID=34407 RepID=A0AAD9Y9U9_COLKA|nr:hypothetical protein CKAH01_06872 [Colletotrichum kahawae]